MSVGIEELDRGVVWGDTWHGIGSYETQETPVTKEQATEILDYPLIKVPLFCNLMDKDADDFNIVPRKVGAWSIVREDYNMVLVPAVGSRFEIMDNIRMLEWVDEHLLSKFDDVDMESVGTLFNGATAFINLKMGEMVIKGDESETVNRVMWFNPLGKGSYGACAHSIRVVCNNTLRAAAAQGVLNDTLTRFRHTQSAEEKIEKHVESIQELKIGFESYELDLNALTETEMDTEDVATFLSKLFKVDIKKATERQKVIAQNKKDAVLEQFEGEQGLECGIERSRYAFLQALTYYLDHNTIKNGDAASLTWDGLVGQRATIKAKVFQDLLRGEFTEE